MNRWLGVLLVTAAGACGPSPAEQASTTPSPQVPAPLPVPGVGDDALATTWWAFAPSLPFIALKMSLVPEDGDEGSYVGSWVSFDWRGTQAGDSPFRPSRPVAIRARLTDDRLVVSGPVPQLDAAGFPNGQRGHFELRVQVASLPGEALHYSGRMLHATLAPGEGVAVELSPRFRKWNP